VRQDLLIGGDSERTRTLREVTQLFALAVLNPRGEGFVDSFGGLVYLGHEGELARLDRALLLQRVLDVAAQGAVRVDVATVGGELLDDAQPSN